ncbi:MAG TPA: Holliday junction resolvase RuvX [Acidobacteriota bacterium]|nr:Holliday junction resolvase RuvX [Acidobacteriota bacterium]
MVYLCLDMGARRIGVAVSDPTGMLARPLDTLPGGEPTAEFAKRLQPIVRDNGAQRLVIGLPKRLSGAHGPEAVAIETAATELHNLLHLPVILWDERLSTVEATRRLIESGVSRKRRKQLVDRVAAALILQSYLDSLDSSEAPVP